MDKQVQKCLSDIAFYPQVVRADRAFNAEELVKLGYATAEDVQTQPGHKRYTITDAGKAAHKASNAAPSREPLHIQIRHIETVGPGSLRPIYRVVTPAEWTDAQIRAGFREAAGRWAGYLFKPYEKPVRGAYGDFWVGLDAETVRGLLARGEGRKLAVDEAARLAALHPELADEIRRAAEGAAS
jgi:hypothetical protein